MQVMNLRHPHELIKENLKETALAIGYFDGVHKGHQQVISTAKRISDEKGYQSGVMTFHPHPSVVLNKESKHVEYITPIEDKLELFEKLGIDIVYVVDFNEALAQLEPQEFVDSFLIGLNVKHVVAGFDFSYGKAGKGSMETLANHSRGKFTQTKVPKVSGNGKKVSSTIIRQELENGNMKAVKELLGRPHSLKGTVISGDKRGRTIGYPTANLELKDSYLLPRIGVYAVAIRLNKDTYYGMANIGYKPTFQNEIMKPSIEVYIFDFDGNIYGEELILELFDYVREEKKFSGIEELKEQLKKDEEDIRHFFSTSLT